MAVMKHLRALFLCICLGGQLPLHAQNFAGDVYLIGYSVSDNGSAGMIPSFLNAPSQVTDFPAAFENPQLSLESASLPLYGGLAEMITGAMRLPIDSSTEVVLLGAILTDDGIETRPQLTTTAEQRAVNPGDRPKVCSSCPVLRNVDYPAYLNVKRTFRLEVPRLDFSWRYIPLDLRLGVTAKYFKSELEGDPDEYIAQNINMDGGVQLVLHWDYHRTTGVSGRRFTLDFSGFELLQTPQFSRFAEEKVESRFHWAFYWDENLPSLKSRVRVGVNQRTERSRLPGVGAELEILNLLNLRAGGDTDIISGGVSLKYKFLALHYAFQHHELAANPYQISLELLPLAFF